MIITSQQEFGAEEAPVTTVDASKTAAAAKENFFTSLYNTVMGNQYLKWGVLGGLGYVAYNKFKR